MVPAMRYLATSIVFLALASFVNAGPSLKQARQEWLEGYYAEARESFEKLAKDAATRQPATLGLSRAWESQGQYDKAQVVVEALLKDLPKDADLLARL